MTLAGLYIAGSASGRSRTDPLIQPGISQCIVCGNQALTGYFYRCVGRTFSRVLRSPFEQNNY